MKSAIFALALLHPPTEVPDGWTVKQWNQFVASAKLGKVILEQKDIQSYDATHAELTLTEDGSKKMRANRIPFGGKVFVITLGERRLLGGMFLEISSERPLRFPVGYWMDGGPQVILRLRPQHSVHNDTKVPEEFLPELHRQFSN